MTHNPTTSEDEPEYFTPLHHAIAELLGYKQTSNYATWDKVEETAPVQVVERLVNFIHTHTPATSEDELDPLSPALAPETLKEAIERMAYEAQMHPIQTRDVKMQFSSTSWTMFVASLREYIATHDAIKQAELEKVLPKFGNTEADNGTADIWKGFNIAIDQFREAINKVYGDKPREEES